MWNRYNEIDYKRDEANILFHPLYIKERYEKGEARIKATPENATKE
jgi:hypothetical protein